MLHRILKRLFAAFQCAEGEDRAARAAKVKVVTLLLSRGQLPIGRNLDKKAGVVFRGIDKRLEFPRGECRSHRKHKGAGNEADDFFHCIGIFSL